MPDTLKLNGPLDEWLGKYLSHYRDDSSSMQPKDAVRILAERKFIKNKNDLEFYGGRSHSNFWFALQVKNITGNFMPLFWSFNTSDLEFVLYDASDTGNIRFVDSASSHTPMALRSIPARGITFRVNLKPGETKLLLVKVYPLDIDYVNFPTNITTVEDYFLWEKEYASYIFFYLGTFVIALLANIFLGVLLRNKIHLWHAAYIFTLILWNLNEFLFESLVLPHWIFPFYIRLPKVFFLLLSMVFALTVFQVFTNQRLRHPRLFKCFQGYKAIVIALEAILFCSIFSERYQWPLFMICRNAGAVLGISGIVLLLISIGAGFIKKEMLVMLYAFISLFLILSILNNQLYEWFDFPLFNVYPNNLSVSVAVEIFLLTIVFAYSRKLEWEKSWKTNKELLNLKNEVSLRIIATQEEERKRIAQDLHDELGGNLAAMKMHLQSMGPENGKLARMIALIDEASNNVRDISHNLMPPEFESTPLTELLKHFFHKLNSESNIHFDFILSGPQHPFDKQKALMIYRILLELTQNIIRHSNAARSTIQLVYYDSYVELMAEDDGSGFVNKGSDGIGLKNIRSRVDFLQGRMNIDSGTSGTTITIIIPYFSKV